MGANGLLVADPEVYPHMLMAGTSGSGKTRFGYYLCPGIQVAGDDLRLFWAGFSAFSAASERPCCTA
jgi:hypothetical protein